MKHPQTCNTLVSHKFKDRMIVKFIRTQHKTLTVIQLKHKIATYLMTQ